MGQRCEAARAVQHRDDLLGRRAGARHERGTSRRQPAIERLARVGDVAGGDHGARDLRAADRSPAVLARLRHDRDDVDRHAELREPIAHGLDARNPLRALPRQEPGQLRVLRIDEVAEDVHVAAGLDGGDFDPADGLDAARAAPRLHLGDRGGRVVIGDRHRRHAGGRGAVDELLRRAAAVGRGRMKVEVYHVMTRYR